MLDLRRYLNVAPMLSAWDLNTSETASLPSANRRPARVQIPILPALAASLAATPTGHLCLLTTAEGKPFTAAGFGNWFRAQCDAAGLDGCSAHGLRKVATRRLAEAGCTDEEMMAITGHRTRSELSRYSRGASQKIGAKAAFAKLMAKGADGEQTTVKPHAGIVKP